MMRDLSTSGANARPWRLEFNLFGAESPGLSPVTMHRAAPEA